MMDEVAACRKFYASHGADMAVLDTCAFKSDAMQLAIRAMGQIPRDFGLGEPVKEPTKVYRVEMADGTGPYNSAVGIGVTISAPFEGFDCNRPAVENNEKMGVSDRRFHREFGHANYGCESLADIDYWFGDKARQYIAAHGGRIAVYEVQVGQHLVKAGLGEVVFNRYSAKLIEYLPLT